MPRPMPVPPPVTSAVSATDLVSESHRAEGQARAAAYYEDMVTTLDAPAFDGVSQSQWDRRGDAVATGGEVDNQLLAPDATVLQHGDSVLAGLVGHDSIKGSAVQFDRAKEVIQKGTNEASTHFEDGRALHVKHVHL